MEDQAAANQSQVQGHHGGTPPRGEEEESKKEEEELIAKVNKLMEKTTSAPDHDNPNPTVLHALASILETQESRFVSSLHVHVSVYSIPYCSV